MQKAQKLLNHYLKQAVYYKIQAAKKPVLNNMYLMFQDKILGAVAMLESLDCPSDLKHHARTVRLKIYEVEQMKPHQLDKLLQELEKPCN